MTAAGPKHFGTPAAIRARGAVIAAFRLGAETDRVTAWAWAAFARRILCPEQKSALDALFGEDHEQPDPLLHFAGVAWARFEGPAGQARWEECEAGDGRRVAVLPVLDAAAAPLPPHLSPSVDWLAGHFAASCDVDRDHCAALLEDWLGHGPALVARDVLAFALDDGPSPAWARRTGDVRVLGEAVAGWGFVDPVVTRRLRLYRHPLDFFRAGNATVGAVNADVGAAWPLFDLGGCILDDRDPVAERLLMTRELVCDDAAHAAATAAQQRRIRKRWLADLPKPRPLRVRRAGEAAA